MQGERAGAVALIGVAALLGVLATIVILYFQLAKSGRFPPDDLCIFARVQELGVLGTQLRQFMTWSGRWASNLFVSLVMAIPGRSPSLFGHSLALLALAAVTAVVTVHAAAAGRVAARVRPLLALVTVALIFCATPDRGDSWFFAFSSLENLVPVCCGALALACVLGAGARPWLVVPGAVATALAAGGHECVSLSWLSVGGALLAWGVVRTPGRARRTAIATLLGEPRLRAAAIVLAVATLSFVVCVASPGAKVRAKILHHAPATVAFAQTLAGGPRLVAEVVGGSWSVLLATLLVWAWAARCFAPAPVRVGGREVAGVALALGVLAIVVGCATALPGYYALGEAPPARAQLALAVYLVGAVATIGVQLGGALHGSRIAAPALLVAMLVVLAIVVPRQRARLVADVATARIYARAYDARLATLRAASGRDATGPVVLDPLPPSGVLRSAEISPDAARSYANRCLAQAVGLRTRVLRRPDAPG